MSNDIQDKEALKEYLYRKYVQLCDEIVTFTISEHGAGRKKAEEK